MAPAPQLSAPGTAAYDSNTMHVGDGTWDFTKNTFLLPNLVGMNAETMRYNGMGNRFSTVPQYHRLVLAHGILAAFVFLLFVPVGVLYARFYTSRPERAITHHSRLQLLGGLLLIAVFALGNIAVGPSRSLTNPHHGIGIAIFLLFILQVFGGWMVRHIVKARSLRLRVHRWFGRTTATLGIIQVPLGLTLYGSPLYLFVLYAVWMAFLLMLYFVLDHRRDRYHDRMPTREDSRPGSSYVSDSERTTTVRTDLRRREKEKSGWSSWLLPAAAGAGLWAMFRKRSERERSRSRGRGGSSSRLSRNRSDTAPEVLSSRHGSYYDDEKYSDRTEPQKQHGGSRIGRLFLAFGAALGLGKLIQRVSNRREQKRDEGYSEVSASTPNRHRHIRPPPTETDLTETDTSFSPVGGRTTLPGTRSATAARRDLPRYRPRSRSRSRSTSLTRVRSPPRPRTKGPPPTARVPGGSRYSHDESEWTQSASRRADSSHHSAEKKGILAGLGLGWLAGRFATRKEEDMRENSSRDDVRAREEEDRRSGALPPRFTADGYSATTPPSRKRTQRRPSQPVPPPAPTPVRMAPPTRTAASFSNVSEEASTVEPQPGRSNFSGPPMPPLVAATVPGSTSAARPGSSRPVSGGDRDGNEPPIRMPAMPADPHGPFYSDDGARGDGRTSPSTHAERRRSRRRRAGNEAAAAAVAAVNALPPEERQAGAERETQPPPKPPVHIRVQVHDDENRNVTFRRMTQEEIAERSNRRRSDSISSSEGTETPGSRRGYRRDSSVRRAEEHAERKVGEDPSRTTLIPPRARSLSASAGKPKDSAYYSGGQPGVGLQQPGATGTVSSIATTDTSGIDTAEGSAADIRRYRRRQERRRPDGSSAAHDNGSDMWT